MKIEKQVGVGKTILIVEDSTYMRELIRSTLAEAGHEIIGEASNGAEAIDLAIKFKPDLIILDNILPDMVGSDILIELRKEGITSKIVMISSVRKKSVIENVMALGVAKYIVKPFTSEDLVEEVNKIIKK